jgi:hypothetical protein
MPLLMSATCARSHLLGDDQTVTFDFISSLFDIVSLNEYRDQV